jgi:hypothetical protein
MINTVNGLGKYVIVEGGMPSITYMNTSSGYMNVGDLRYNPTRHKVEVYDGNNWITLNSGHASVRLTSHAETVIDWAAKKMQEDMELEALSKSNPTIADLVEQKKNLDHKIKMVQILIKEEPKVGTN